ncbi:hypothetical protein [Priestia megaterium]|uniref:hypothetical protein n=1 Tax=Priestia megaterium TaxID=1404 RepID=UPI0023D9B43C|nr:hypothetical protein [Priestia megaterium]MDF2053147.1 hypothetical protein [Priestia megaterium]
MAYIFDKMDEKSKVVPTTKVQCKENQWQQLLGPVKQTTFDIKTATEPKKKFLNYDIEAVICYHRGIFSEDVRPHISKILNEQFI